ncbi:PKD domain-containing protein [Cellulomonas dongxiuzhuiae]|uniref:PKD domain-containing protein n=1 Tax=Cellulomonas dongxiuzhuiae TaxID=2819979 RepID=A0ABX8GNU5_9CELL|nr:PKD domain-containing protein [Cellulomonas dongxiuzhuiae]MBO3096483.1 PKD domain-containing protein [Cellulomonas dongxiuzhuiae]QWC16879.1 PKD domain-containing protein [Cellulomonas dongxiuzhuiae]
MSATLLLGGVATAAAPPALADDPPPLPPSVSADALPTAQIDGVVWKQVAVGGTVYVGGSFSAARPPGVALGGSGTVPRAHMMAYDLATGALSASFAPTFNGQVSDLVASADGRTLYAVGAFTTVNGQSRNRAAAFDIPSGTLKPWAPNLNGYAKGVTVAPNGTVYIAGNFSHVGSTARPKVAAFHPTTAALQPFTAPVDDYQVNAIQVSPDGQTAVIGGNFTGIGGESTQSYGLARLDAATGALLPLPVASTVRNAGARSAIASLSSDATGFYGTGWHIASTGTIEGTFKASWDTGELVWLEDCHGDTYSAAPAGDVVYIASHKHYCGNSGGFPQTDPWSFYHGTAVTNDVRGVNTRDIYNYPDHPGTPRPEFLEWYPTFVPGTYTGQGQGPWTVTAAGSYVLFGGEFLRVNGTGQQGIVRFLDRSSAPNKVGPTAKGSAFALGGLSYASGEVRLTWPGNPDRDDATVRYDLYRQSTSTPPIHTESVTAPFWTQPTMSFVDKGLTPGSSQRYRVIATDPWGNASMSDWYTVTVSDAPVSDYAREVLADEPSSYWRFGEPSGTAVYDWMGANDLTTTASVTRGAAGAPVGDPNTAATFPGTTAGTAATRTAAPAPNVFSVETWFRTTSRTGGKIIGYGNRVTGASGSYDRHVYMTSNGRLAFGVYPGTARTVTSTASYNDGAWHHVVATLGSGGMQLYVDGKRVGQRTDTTMGQAYNGYWRIGGDVLSSWLNRPSTDYFAGTIDEVAVYPRVLTPQEIRSHVTAAGYAAAIPPAPADPYGAAVYAADPELFWRFDEATGSALADSGASGNAGTLTGTGWTRQAAGALAAHEENRSVRFVEGSAGAATTATFENPRAYSLEAWFSTTSSRGGRVLGFSSRQTGTAGDHDRHIYLQDDGRLVFGAWTGTANTITSAEPYNDGQWHHVLATQGPDGMVLYVDGASVGTNPQVDSQAYTGYWRVANGATWGSTSAALDGRIDEVAVYSRPLSGSDAVLHAGLGRTGTTPNLPPQAAFDATLEGRELTLDGSASTDADGAVTSWAWDLGDGTTAQGVTPPAHTYDLAGTYTVTLTVTDDKGATSARQQSVTVANAPPVATFTVAASHLDVAVDASASTDPDGAVVGYSWRFGDGATATGATASHTYASAGTYTVTLTVSDHDGTTTTTTQDVTVAPNQAPVAGFVAQPSALAVAFAPVGTADPDGTVASYAWDFGDGATSAQEAPTHTYVEPGTYTVRLTVTDDLGATGTTSSRVVVTANAAPVAAFTPTTALLRLAVDASASSDPDGSVVAYVWDFGDGAQAAGVAAEHTYSSPGTYTVTLTVRDNQGTETSVSHDVEAVAPTMWAHDRFSRSAATGWGSSDAGGAWTHFGSAAQYSVADGTGRVSIGTTASTPRLQLRSVAATDSDQTVQFSLDKVPVGGGGTVALTSRGGSWSSLYRGRVWVRANGTVSLLVTRIAGAESTLAAVNVPGLTLTAGTPLNVRFRTEGSSPTALRLKAWTGPTEPAAWQVQTTDATTELQDAGAVGIDTGLDGGVTNAPVRVTIDEFFAGQPGSAAPNQVPVPAFAATATDLSVAVDGSTSADADGTVTAWSWDFGDGSPAVTGTQVTHAYAADGTYPVTLTVTDNRGATASVTQQVTASSPAGDPMVAPVAAFEASPLGLTVSVDGSASSAGDAPVVAWAWDFGDGEQGDGAQAQHTYAAAGTYAVTLTVTGPDGATDTLTREVTVAAVPAEEPPVEEPPVEEPPVDGALAQDVFDRTVATGWGTSATGGAWSHFGSAAQYSVAPGVGTLQALAPGATPRVRWADLAVRDVDVLGQVSLDSIGDGGGTFVALTARSGSWSSMYRGQVWVKSTGALNLVLTRIAPRETILAQVNVAGVTLAAGERLNVRFQAVGSDPTTLRLRTWKDGTPEPTTWHLTATDATPELQDAGGVGVDGLLSGTSTNAPVRIRVHGLTVTEAV